MTFLFVKTDEFWYSFRQIATERNLIVLVVNNIIISKSTYFKNFKDNHQSKERNTATYKPSLGKLFSDAANIRLRIDYLKDDINQKGQTLEDRSTKRQIFVETNNGCTNSFQRNENSCLIKITNKGFENMWYSWPLGSVIKLSPS